MAAAETRIAGPRYKVYFHLSNEIYSGDLVFVEGRPLLVVSWRTVEGKRAPFVTFPLDATMLKVINRLGTLWRYGGEIFDRGTIRRASRDDASTVVAQSRRLR